jgi:quercetin dioxygenase-like cupin family protein
MHTETSNSQASINNQAMIVTPNEGEFVRPFGLDMRIMLTTEQTGGALAAVYARHEPEQGPIDHVHFHQEEYFLVIEGTYKVTAGDVTRTAGPGTLCFIPRGVVHSFKNVGTSTASMLDWSIPGGQDKYFRTIHELGEGGGFDAGKIVEISRAHDTEFPKRESAADL